MRKFTKSLNCILIVVFLVTFVVSIVWLLTFSLIPPDKEKMEKCFQQDKGDLIVISDYLGDLDYSYISIDKSDIKNGVMFTGANTRYQKIDDNTVVESLNRMLNNRKYILIGKNDNTVFFQKWRFLEKDRGIAVSVNKEEPPLVEFLIKSETLSEIGWHYYEADYEEYRKMFIR